jgi:hypothetical protein
MEEALKLVCTVSCVVGLWWFARLAHTHVSTVQQQCSFACGSHMSCCHLQFSGQLPSSTQCTHSSGKCRGGGGGVRTVVGTGGEQRTAAAARHDDMPPPRQVHQQSWHQHQHAYQHTSEPCVTPFCVQPLFQETLEAWSPGLLAANGPIESEAALAVVFAVTS